MTEPAPAGFFMPASKENAKGTPEGVPQPRGGDLAENG